MVASGKAKKVRPVTAKAAQSAQKRARSRRSRLAGTQAAASKPVARRNTQPVLGSHESAVHGSRPAQLLSAVEQVPVSGSPTPALWQASEAVQTTCVHWALGAGAGATRSARRPT